MNMVRNFGALDRQIPLVSLIVAILAVAAGAVLNQPRLFGGFQLGLFLAWVTMPVLTAAVVMFEMTYSEGDN